jgi:xylose isomerase
MAYFPEVTKVAYEGPDSKNPLAFRHYNPTEMIDGKSMHDHLRFAVCYWHTMCGSGADPFGPGTMHRPWDEQGGSPTDIALRRVDVFFELVTKLQ